MGPYRRMVWTEGMLLGPHHFQQAERYLLGEMGHRLDLVLPHSWGVRRLAIDEEALGNGHFHLLELDAILPDGSAVRFPTIDPVPTGRDLTGVFGADRAEMDVYVALPDDRPGTPRCRAQDMPGAADSRFRSESVRVQDENAPGSEAEIAIAHSNARLLLSGENLDGFTVLKIARLKRSTEGVIVRDPDYAPPSLSIEAAGPTLTILRTVLESLSAKSDTLKVQTRQAGGKVQYGTSDVMLFWQVHTVNSAIPTMSHFQRTPDTHPVDLYLAMVELLGSLCTFAEDRHPREIPPYQHEDLGGTFRGLERLFRSLIEISDVSRHERVALAQVNEAQIQGEITDERLFGAGYQWFLAVHGPLTEDRIRDEVPGKISIGSSHNVEFLVRQALRGVGITYTAIPSSDFPIKSGYVYFRLDTHDETWETIKEARTIAIYLRGAELKGLSFELIVTQT
ncbi:MAG: type VI secretion protein [Gemmatimonadota bacterium]|nr:MAG: type VI secretion protein [Gemmatimonadota bacterium]